MNIKKWCLLATLGLWSMGLMAEDENQQSQLDEINGQIKMEQEANQKLKDDLSAREKEVTDLKEKLKELEEKTKK